MNYGDNSGGGGGNQSSERFQVWEKLLKFFASLSVAFPFALFPQRLAAAAKYEAAQLVHLHLRVTHSLATSDV